MSEWCRRRGCGTKKVERKDAIGRLWWDCPSCARNKQGLCKDCPAKLENPRAVRCDRCGLAQTRRLDNTKKKHLYRTDPAFRERECRKKRQWRADPERREALNAKARERYHRKGTPKRDALDLAAARAWRASHPLTKKQRQRYAAQRRRRYHTDAEFRERIRESNRRSRATKPKKPRSAEYKARRAAAQRERYATDPVYRAQRIAAVAAQRAKRRAQATTPITQIERERADRITARAS